MLTQKPVRPARPKTPVTDQVGRMRFDLQPLVDFLRWLDARGRLQHLNPWNPEDWVAEFRGIDMDALAAERRAILEYNAAMQRYWADVEVWRTQIGGRT